MKRTWSNEDDNYLRNNIQKIDIKDIAASLNRTERAVKLYIFRQRIDTGRPKVKNNLLRKLLEEKFRDIRYFTPGKEFYNKVGITQVRWYKILRGECQILPEEYNRVAKELKISAEEIVASRQLSLFSDINEKI